MKKAFILSILGLIFEFGFSQETSKVNNSYNIFSCKDCRHKYFAASNSGIMNTPIGIRVGFLCRTGAYIGTRFGKGEIYHSDSDLNTVETNLFSITGGFIMPIYVNTNFSIHGFLGAGYGQWWQYRWERWTNEGVELEGGLMTTYKRFMFIGSVNMLDGYKTYETWDYTIGLGYRF